MATDGDGRAENLLVKDDVGDLVSTSEDLKAALRALPARQRCTVGLRYYVGLDVTEIAELMGIGDSSVRSAISRALAALNLQHDPTAQEPSHAHDQ